jgi:hypothetical protein
MSKPQTKRLNDLEAKYNFWKDNKPFVMLFTHHGYETLEEAQTDSDKTRMTQREAKEEAFKLSGKPGKIEDYLLMNIQGVAVPPSEDAMPVCSARELNNIR